MINFFFYNTFYFRSLEETSRRLHVKIPQSKNHSSHKAGRLGAGTPNWLRGGFRSNSYILGLSHRVFSGLVGAATGENRHRKNYRSYPSNWHDHRLYLRCVRWRFHSKLWRLQTERAALYLEKFEARAEAVERRPSWRANEVLKRRAERYFNI